MPDVRELLHEAERRIIEWQALIATQKQRIAEMKRGGHHAAGSIALLREMEESSNSMRHERKMIEGRIELHQRLTQATELAPRS